MHAKGDRTQPSSCFASNWLRSGCRGCMYHKPSPGYKPRPHLFGILVNVEVQEAYATIGNTGIDADYNDTSEEAVETKLTTLG